MVSTTAFAGLQPLALPVTVLYIFINIGSNLDPTLPSSAEVASVAFEPVVGCRIPHHERLYVVHAAVSDMEGLSSMAIYNKAGKSSTLGTPAVQGRAWSDQSSHGMKPQILVPVVSMASVLAAMPPDKTIWFLKTDMQVRATTTERCSLAGRGSAVCTT